VNLPYSEVLLSNCIFLKLAAYFTVSAPKLVAPNVYSYTELMIRKECRKRPLFTIITVVAKVTDRALRSPK